MKKNITYITLKLTNRCNMKCYMCGQRYVRDYLSQEDLPIEIIEKCLSEIDTLKTIYIFGGEVLLYKDFSKLLRYLANRKISVLMNTNGVFINKYAQSLIDSKVRDVTFSIDSFNKDAFAKIRGINAYDIVLENLKLLIELKKRAKSELPYIGINCVILPENIDELEEYYDVIRERFPEVERINFESPIFTTYNMGTEYSKICKEFFNCDGDSWKWFYKRIPQYTSEQINRIVDTLNKLRNKTKVTFMVENKDTEKSLEESFLEEYKIPELKCNFANYSVTILPNGDVTYCTDFPDNIVGNIMEESLIDIFNNDKSNTFRKYIEQYGNLPICSKCPRQHSNEENFIKDL